MFVALGFWPWLIDGNLGEVAGGPRSDSPLIDVEAMSDEEAQQIDKQPTGAVGQFNGAQVCNK